MMRALPLSRSSDSKGSPCQSASREGSPPRKFTFCFFCGRDGHIRAQCRVCTSYLAVRRCRIVGGRVVLPTGEEIPREALGRTLQAHLDFWALARAHRVSDMQIPAPPSSSLSLHAPASVRDHPEMAEKELSSLKVTEPPSSPTHALVPEPRAPMMRPSQIPGLVSAHSRASPWDDGTHLHPPLPSPGSPQLRSGSPSQSWRSTLSVLRPILHALVQILAE
ncbi:hypothetical protein EDC04DRAFT_126787 [Pisolithus marmoratus]|nr:hypothetical protein EDC04DRAFT_126787 [Pisolithus marmoratus]